MTPTATPRTRARPRSARVDAWCAGAVGGAVGLGYAAAFLALQHTVGEGELGLWVVAALGIMLIPFVEPVFANDPNTSTRARHLLQGGAILARLVLLVFLCTTTRNPEDTVPALLLAAQSLLVSRSSIDPAAVLAISTALMQAGLAAVAARGPTSSILLLLQLVVSVVAFVMLHARATRARVVRATVHRQQVPDEARPRLLRRVAFGVGLAFVVAATAIGLDGAVQELREDPKQRRPGAAGPGEVAQDPGVEEAGPQPAVGARFPSSLDLAPSIDPLGADRILQVRLLGLDGSNLGDRGPLLLAGMRLDQFTRTGLDLDLADGPRLVRDEDDGTSDGWIELEPRRNATADDFFVEVTQGVIEVGAAGEAPVFRPEPAYAVELDEALVEPHGWLSTTGPEGLLTYRVATRRREVSLPSLRGVPATHPERRYLGLPPDSPDLDAIRARAAEVVAGSVDDAARVEAVLRHFRTTYRYSFEASGFQGVAGLRDFLERREGFCTWFASAAALLLRIEGVPTRVATGYRCREWSAEEQRFVVRERDGHAWLEVHFDGVGWVPLDPTPQAAIDQALDEMFGLDDEGDLASWYSDLTDAVAAWTDPTNEDGSLSAVVRAVYDLPGALLRSARGNALVAGSLGALVVLLALWTLRKRVRGALEAAGVRAPGTERSTFYWHRVLRALERRGHRKRPGQTPREFAAAVLARADEDLAPLAGVVDVLYLERYAGVPPAEEDVRRIAAFVERLRASQSSRATPS